MLRELDPKSSLVAMLVNAAYRPRHS
jgi:hypothetical protein